jgi:hypothetical protein
MTKLLAGVLCCGLAVLAGVAEDADPAVQPKAVQLKPGMLIVMGEEPGPTAGSQFRAYAWDGKAKRPELLFRRRSSLCGDMHAFTVGRDGRQYYLNGNRWWIVQADKAGQNEKVLFQRKPPDGVRDLALDNDDNVYFSESHGGAADGHIYRLRPRGKLLTAIAKEEKDRRTQPPARTPSGPANEEKGDDLPASAELFCDVHLRDLDGPGVNPHYWAGNFAFARDAKGALDTNTLYLSSGNTMPAGIFRMTRKDGVWSKPKLVFVSPLEIMKLVFTNPREAYFVRSFDFRGRNQVFRLTDLKRVESVLTLPVKQVWHVSLVPSPAEKLIEIIEKKK